MDYISRLADEELRTLCGLIPLKHFRDYFKMHPKSFNKLSKFRPKKVPLSEIQRIVVNRGNDPFVLRQHRIKKMKRAGGRDIIRIWISK